MESSLETSLSKILAINVPPKLYRVFSIGHGMKHEVGRFLP
jgi:hypothetical protein